MGNTIYSSSGNNNLLNGVVELSDTILTQQPNGERSKINEKSWRWSYYFTNIDDAKTYKIVMDDDNGITSWDSDGKNPMTINVPERFSVSPKSSFYVQPYIYEPSNDKLIEFSSDDVKNNSMIVRSIIPSFNGSDETLLNKSLLVGHTEHINAVFNLPDGRILSSSYDRTLRVWNLKTGTCEVVLTGLGKSSYIRNIVIISSDRILTIASCNTYDNEIRIWNITNGKCLAMLIVQGSCGKIAARQYLIESKDMETYQIVIAMNGIFQHSFDKHEQYDKERTIKLWNVETNNNFSSPVTVKTEPDYVKVISPDETKTNLYAHYYYNEILCVAILRDGQILYGIANKLKLLNPMTSDSEKIVSNNHFVSDIIMLPDERFIAVTNIEGNKCGILSK